MTDNFKIHEPFKEFCTINADGTVTIPAGVTLDEAAAAFWIAVAAKGPATRIAALEALLSDVNTGYAECIATREDYRARIAALEAALKPFADVNSYSLLEDTTRVYDEAITYGDLRAARAAMEGKDD